MSERPRRTPVPSQKVKESTGAQPGAQRERREAAPSASSGSFVALAQNHAKQIICAAGGEEQPDDVDGEGSDVEEVPASLRATLVGVSSSSRRAMAYTKARLYVNHMSE